jgi:hypothetical protein
MIEPTVEELLSDPIARLLMEYDGLTAEIVWECVRVARRKLRDRERRERAEGLVDLVA